MQTFMRILTLGMLALGVAGLLLFVLSLAPASASVPLTPFYILGGGYLVVCVHLVFSGWRTRTRGDGR